MVERCGMESPYHDISFKKFGCKKSSSKHTLRFQISMPFLFDKDAFLTFFLFNYLTCFSHSTQHITLSEPQVLLGPHLGTHSPLTSLITAPTTLWFYCWYPCEVSLPSYLKKILPPPPGSKNRPAWNMAGVLYIEFISSQIQSQTGTILTYFLSLISS